ncbi:hypothetical protein BH24ACT18_BH24ACT18_11450 [soil metagenome]
MGHTDTNFSKNVFINCPFDSKYVVLLRPLLFTLVYLGYVPRIASESLDSGKPRIEKIVQLITESKFSIHDLSRLQSSERDEFYRLNMPFELGIDFGCRSFAEGDAKFKRFLILEKRYRQELWIGFSGHAATFASVPSTSSPFLNSAPALTNATR